MKLRVEPYRFTNFKELQWWEYLDLAWSCGVNGQTKMTKTKAGTWTWKFTGKIKGIHTHIQIGAWCVDVFLDFREDIEE